MNEAPDVLLVGASLVFIEYLVLSYIVFLRRPLVASALILSAFVLETAFITIPAIPVGINIYLPDLVFLPLFIVGFARIASSPKMALHQAVLLAVMAIFLASFARGASSYGILDAGVEGRLYFYFLAGVLYFSTFSITTLDSYRFLNQWLVASTAITGIALFRWIATFVGLPIAESWAQFSAGAGGGYFRVLQSSHAMTIAIGLFLSLQLNLAKSGAKWQRNLVYVFAPALLVLQHRTVWVVCLVAIFWMFVSRPIYRRRLSTWLSALVVAAAFLALFLLRDSSGELRSSIVESSQNTGTFEWRLEGWKQLLASEQISGPFNRLFGAPFGSGYSRVVGGFITEVSPHSFYVQSLLRLGVLGTLLLGFAFLIAIRSNSASRLLLGPPANPSMLGVWNVVLIASLVYFVTYAPTFELALPLGIALGGSLSLRSPVDANSRIHGGKGSYVTDIARSTPYIP